jgi:hypothetical protein
LLLNIPLMRVERTTITTIILVTVVIVSAIALLAVAISKPALAANEPISGNGVGTLTCSNGISHPNTRLIFDAKVPLQEGPATGSMSLTITPPGGGNPTQESGKILTGLWDPTAKTYSVSGTFSTAHEICGIPDVPFTISGNTGRGVPIKMGQKYTFDGTGDIALGLTSVSAFPGNDLASLLTPYFITFITESSGTIGDVQITFSSGYNIANAKLIEVHGLGVGSLSPPNGQSIFYKVATPENVPAGTTITIGLGDIVNPSRFVQVGHVTVTTHSPTGDVIDAPTDSQARRIVQVTQEMIANGAIGTPQIQARSITPDQTTIIFAKCTITSRNWNPFNDLTHGMITGGKCSVPGALVGESVLAFRVVGDGVFDVQQASVTNNGEVTIVMKQDGFQAETAQCGICTGFPGTITDTFDDTFALIIFQK